ncbi:MAG: hypothetical protein ACYCWW_04990 [Deltaproteobacteria bacterium]
MRSLLLLPVALLASTAFAQAAGGYSVGPGLPIPADQPEDGQYETRVETFKASPAYTQDRDFPGTRFWKLDPGSYEVEGWWTGETLSQKLGGGQDNFYQTEIEMGLASHVQIDVYLNVDNPPHSVDYNLDGLAVELRYSIARNYGDLWANPVLYLEFTPQYFNSPRLEGRLLFGGNLLPARPGLVVAAGNFYYEQNLVPAMTPDGIDAELGFDGAASVQIFRDTLRLGGEVKAGLDDHAVLRLTPGLPRYQTLLVGPNFIVKLPSNALKLMGTIFFGTQPYDPAVEPMLVLGTMWR